MDLGVAGIKLLSFRPEMGPARRLQCWFYPGSLGEDKGEAGAFRDFLVANGLGGARVVCNIEDSSLKIRRVDLPKMPDGDLREAIRWQLRDVLEGPATDYVLRYSVIEEYLSGETKKLALVAYAIKKEIIQERVQFLKGLSLIPEAIEPTSVSLIAAFHEIHGWKTGEFYGLIDLGESKSVFLAMGEGKLYFSRPLAGISGRDLQSVLAKEFGLSEDDAGRLKRHLFEGSPPAGPLSGLKERAEALTASFYTQICLETQRSLDAFFLMFRKEKIHHLFLCGGGATMPGLSAAMSRNLALETSVLDPRKKFGETAPLSHLFDAALGLALY